MPRTVLHALFLTFIAASLALIGGAAVSRAQGAEECAESGPRICLSVTASPETVSPSRQGSPTYVSYDVVASNRGVSTATHATLAAALPAGATFVSAAPEVGSCTAAGGSVTCQFGSLTGGSTVAARIVVQSPTNEGEAVATFTMSFDERSNDGVNADPKQDTVTVSEAVGVAATRDSAASFVPEGASVELSTDPTGTGVATTGDRQVAGAAIRSAPASISALLKEVPGPLACPKRVICRDGDWVQATIPGTFDPPLAFGLRWDATLIPAKLTAKKFAVLTTECLEECPLEVVSARCSSSTPQASELPCLWNVAKLRDGDWVGTLISSHNGFMR